MPPKKEKFNLNTKKEHQKTATSTSNTKVHPSPQTTVTVNSSPNTTAISSSNDAQPRGQQLTRPTTFGTANTLSETSNATVHPSPQTTTVPVNSSPKPNTTATSTNAAQSPVRQPTTPSSVATANIQSPPQPIIAYVHNMSPLKRNKKNTIDYSTLTLQTDASTTQSALCYSKSKRRLLDDNETKRSPVKISRYTLTADKKKIVINERTLITDPDDIDYTFQYCDDEEQPITQLSYLLEDNANEDGITVCAKVVKVSAPKNVVTQHRASQVMEALLLDTSGTMLIDLWNEHIPLVHVDCVYRFTSLSTYYWNNTRKLTSTFNTIIRETFQADLCALQLDQAQSADLEGEQTVQIPSFTTVEEIQRYKSCCHCNKRIIQPESTVITCNHCAHQMRASHCPIKLYVNLNVELNNEKKTLTIFDEVLKEILGEFDNKTVDTQHIVQELLFKENFSVTFNDRNVITKMQ